MKNLLLSALACAATLSSGFSQDSTELTTRDERVSYCIGADIGNTFKEQGIAVDAKALASGVADALAGKSALSEEEMAAIMGAFQKEMMSKMQAKQASAAADNLTAGEAFLAANREKDGVTVLPSGMQYKVLKSGNGKSPGATDTVKTHYHGTLIDGTVFDSSVDRGEPVTFPVNGVIPGWTEALQLMQEGDKWQLFIPRALAYGERGAGGQIGPNATLIFEVELLSVE
jgi:FKBP-type peptidyl-prolyl cis-trans isomerase FklB